LGRSSFGYVTDARAPRQIQFGLILLLLNRRRIQEGA
jgi:hypothetical protein